MKRAGLMLRECLTTSQRACVSPELSNEGIKLWLVASAADEDDRLTPRMTGRVSRPDSSSSHPDQCLQNRHLRRVRLDSIFPDGWMTMANSIPVGPPFRQR